MCRFFKDYSLGEFALEVFKRYSTHLVATDEELPDFVQYVGVHSVRALLLQSEMSSGSHGKGEGGGAEEASVATVVLRMTLQWLQLPENEGRIHLLGATRVSTNAVICDIRMRHAYCLRFLNI